MAFNKTAEGSSMKRRPMRRRTRFWQAGNGGELL